MKFEVVEKILTGDKQRQRYVLADIVNGLAIEGAYSLTGKLYRFFNGQNSSTMTSILAAVLGKPPLGGSARQHLIVYPYHVSLITHCGPRTFTLTSVGFFHPPSPAVQNVKSGPLISGKPGHPSGRPALTVSDYALWSHPTRLSKRG